PRPRPCVHPTERSSMRVQKAFVVAAIVLGVGTGSYGIASAAGGSSSSSSTSTTAAQTAPAGPSRGQPWGAQRSDETLLTGDALAKVTAIAQSKVSGGTIVRVETDADGHAKYEAHMTDASGNAVTVYVDASF